MPQKKYTSADYVPTAENQRQRKNLERSQKECVCWRVGEKSVLTYGITKDDKYNQLIRNHVRGKWRN